MWLEEMDNDEKSCKIKLNHLNDWVAIQIKIVANMVLVFVNPSSKM